VVEDVGDVFYSGTGGAYSIPPFDSCHFNQNRDLCQSQPQLLTFSANRTVVNNGKLFYLKLRKERANDIVQTSYRSAGGSMIRIRANIVDLLMCRRQPGIGMFPDKLSLIKADK
jgi:hypothetical protein